MNWSQPTWRALWCACVVIDSKGVYSPDTLAYVYMVRCASLVTAVWFLWHGTANTWVYINKVVDECGLFIWSNLLLRSIWSAPCLHLTTHRLSNLTPACLSLVHHVSPWASSLSSHVPGPLPVHLLFPLPQVRMPFPAPEQSPLLPFLLHWKFFPQWPSLSTLLKCQTCSFLDICLFFSALSFYLLAFNMIARMYVV